MRPDLLRYAAELAKRGEPFALATVVRREAPSSARVGDAALVTRDGVFHGWVGGGCTHPTVVREALRTLEERAPRLVALSPVPSADRRPGVIPLLMSCHSGGSVDIYVEPVLPAPRLVVFGSSPVAQALIRLGKALGYAADVIDAEADRAGFPEADRVVTRAEALTHPAPRGAAGALVCAVVATMGQGDEEAVATAIGLEPAYLGLIASRKRFEQIGKTLRARGVSADALGSIRNPAGLDIGAQLPEEIALSILGEIVQLRRGGQERRAPAESSEAAVPAQAQDPICGMSVPAASTSLHAEFEGHTFYFCGVGCRERFLADPRRYTGVHP